MRVFEVRQITGYIGDLFRTDDVLSDVWLRGEVLDCRRSGNGHWYFGLGDESALLRCVLFRGSALRCAALPADGQSVVVHGSLSFYEARGTCEVVVDQVYPEGLGLAHIELEALKRKLEEEGLFDESRKRPLPYFPRAIGVVTSDGGAVIYDILSVLGRRYPLAQVIFAPASVQGERAPREIVAALARLNRFAESAHLDLIVVARGGGSSSELGCFNDEAVVRAAFASKVPIVSAIGHETDYTLLDLVADLRAPTPSAAAEVVVPDVETLRLEVEDDLLRLEQAIRLHVRSERQVLELAHGRLFTRSPLVETARLKERLGDAVNRGHAALRHQVAMAQQGVEGAALQLQALSPSRTLKRGYSLVCGPSGDVVQTYQGVVSGDAMTIRIVDGEIRATAVGAEPRSIPGESRAPTSAGLQRAAANV